VEREGGRLALQRMDRSVPWWKDLFVMPTIGRYLIMNLELGNPDQLKERIASFFGGTRQFVGNVAANADPGRLSDSEKAVDAFLDMLPADSGLRPDHIVLVLDAPRPEIYSATSLREVEGSYFAIMRRYLAAAALDKGFEVIDMASLFVSDYEKNGIRFEFPSDYHWNSMGHQVVAQAIYGAKAFANVFDRDKDGIVQ
jgi:hypothetical protein